MNTFKADKCAQALNFLAKKEGGKINKMKAIKLIWAADRFHLRKYGRPITDDAYLAMGYGPVGSTTKDIAQLSDFCPKEIRDYAKKYIEKINGYHFKSVSDVDNDVFSESELESLDFIYEQLGQFDQFELADISHAYPEWKKHAGTKGMSIESMSYLDFFNDPEENAPELDPLHGQDPFKFDSKILNESKDTFMETRDIEKMWY